MTRLSSTIAIQKSNCGRGRAAAKKDQATAREKWLSLPKGIHKGKILPEVLINDPSYFFWFLARGFFRGDALRQAEALEKRARHILPPKQNPRLYQFAFEFDEDHRWLSGVWME